MWVKELFPSRPPGTCLGCRASYQCFSMKPTVTLALLFLTELAAFKKSQCCSSGKTRCRLIKGLIWKKKTFCIQLLTITPCTVLKSSITGFVGGKCARAGVEREAVESDVAVCGGVSTM